MSDTFRVLVTGSRSWADRTAVWTALDRVAVEHPSARVVVVHGDASGADKLAVEWLVVETPTARVLAEGADRRTT